MRGTVARSISIALFAATIHLLAGLGLAADDNGYEVPQERSAAAILPADLLEGEHHSVDDLVTSDGYLNYYTVTSDYGEFEAVSTATLRERIGEINALAELDDLSKTEVFIKAAADAGIVAPLRSIKQFATHPIKTVTGIPRGIGRMFKRFTRQADEAVDTTKEFVADDDEESDENEEADGESKDDANVAVDLTESFFGVTSSERAWAEKLGTDPYSTNETLRAAIRAVAWTERLGKFGVGFAGIPAIPGADIIGDVNKVVWSKDPYELQDFNRARLVDTGADAELIEQYLDNPRMSPTQQTLLTATIAELVEVEGRDGILVQALNARTDAEVRFFVRSVALLAWFHVNQNPVVSVITDRAIPGGLTDDGRMVFTFAVDHLYWTDDIARAAGVFAGLKSTGGDHKPEVWLLGRASGRCSDELSAAGWSVHENLAEIMLNDST